eukprot:CAMPEP_0114227794 /NCGR_PEP_ID=MMETSP0058-20121206/1983_1 /TAXON_ID=36894 /ORGANISM="Pyramimonas parkeae, CCMP726" /LENGTH=56 /DNA_ID=CAMNT_0001338665 /DNA_START=577 /DNA_END=747 /DNA_ORIENTATION=-
MAHHKKRSRSLLIHHELDELQCVSKKQIQALDQSRLAAGPPVPVVLLPVYGNAQRL